ncbi:MAG: D-alanine--D-alanine ligase [Alphaproteobacteria bacterium]|nr:D-alanine--D-alanine ligase [Alphaproteobacteria bacterium]
MKVGFTYDLRDDYLEQGFSEEDAAEFDSIETIDAVELSLRKNGYEVERIGNIRALVNALATGKRWDIVFNICEGVSGIAREAQVPALLEAYAIPYTFSPPEVMTARTDKALAKMILKNCNIPTPQWYVIEDARNLPDHLEFPLFLKPLAEGSSKGISEHSLVRDKATFKKSTAHFLARYAQPVLVESYLPGREFTVGLLGTGKTARVLGVMEVDLDGQPDNFGRSYANKDVDWTMPDLYRLAEDEAARKAGALALAAWDALKGRDVGRVDLRCDEKGEPLVLEVNALSGLHPEKSDLCILAAKAGMDHAALIGVIMEEAISRCGLSGGRSRKSVCA